MKFSIKKASPETQRSACVVVGVFEKRQLTPAAVLLNQASGDYISDILHCGDLDGKAGSTRFLHKVPFLPCERVLLVGLGKEKEFHEKEYRAALAVAVKALGETGASEATFFLPKLSLASPEKNYDLAWHIRQAAITLQETLYRFEQLKSKKKEASPALRKLVFAVPIDADLAPAEKALEQGLAIAEGISLARTLGNLPGNICTPTYLAQTAKAIAKEHALKLEILERSEMQTLGMHALLSVAQGSHQAPKLIVLHYQGAKKSVKPQVLVGKGITFDSGGISLKPGPEMDEMKFDMCGAASVLGTIKAVARMKLPINLTVIIPASENLPGGKASKPGDVVTSLSGQTIEILNTDAEGRLVLCDALTYAERFDPARVIDVATLTGACVIALGHVASGLFANDEPLARELLQAGEQAGDRAWQMPIWDDYAELLKSNFADMANIGGRAAGSISAACFLAKFTQKFAWAHLDIAGTAWKSGGNKGATGRPVSLLTHYLLQLAEPLN